MDPTIHRNHLIVSIRLNYLVADPVPGYGSVIVFRDNSERNRLLVKRVIGLPGDEIRFSEGNVYRNGEELEEPYLMRQNVSFSVIPAFAVPDGAVFVLGDNRENSKDSRFMEEPYVTIENIYAEELFQIPVFIGISLA